MDLLQEVTTIKGVGPKTAAQLHKAGIFTLRDLLYYLPRNYENFQSYTHIADLRPGKVIIKGRVRGLTSRRARKRNLSITEAEIYDDTGSVRVVWFNQAYRAKQLSEKHTYLFAGQFGLARGRYQLTSPTATLATEVDATAGIHPIYPAHGSLKPAQFYKFLNNFRANFAFIPDLLPGAQPGVRAEALFNVHFPDDPTKVQAAKQYLSYEEIFCRVLAAELNKQANQQLAAASFPFYQAATRQLVASLPFKLTNAQRRTAWEIMQDLAKTVPMNRLLQGDVGAGKTMVAALAAQQVITGGGQVALLAPTAILATQHADKLQQALEPLGINVALLTGATKHKSELKKHIRQGEVDLIVGTHALLTDDTRFHNLGLCIIDEQHRFGVAQRQKLLTKSPPNLAPHLLAMTATPIPRSLQLTVFGDLDVSILDELPAGRQPITTKILPEIAQKTELYPEVRRVLQQKQQVYWICPAIEDDPRQETASVKSQAAKVQRHFPEARVAWLHGRMKPDEKDRIMADFAAHRTNILVSTTVVEVGVDVPNATMIIIMNAENYGLAQLHQLRGRVGRGAAASSCFLITPGDNRPSRRLRELEKSTDGFHLAEIDLKLRGPGEIYGQLQHGALDFQIASPTDTKTIAAASHAAKQFAKNPQNMVKYPELATIIKTYQQLTTLN